MRRLIPWVSLSDFAGLDVSKAPVRVAVADTGKKVTQTGGIENAPDLRYIL